MNESTNPYQSIAGALDGAAPSASASSRAKIASSSCSALNPLDAEDRLPQPLQSEHEQQRADHEPQRVERDQRAAPARARP